MKRFINILLILTVTIILSIFAVNYLVKKFLWSENHPEIILLDKDTGYSYSIYSGDTVFYYYIDSLKRYKPAEDVESEISYTSQTITNSEAINGRTTYVYRLSKQDNSKSLSHIIPHEVALNGIYDVSVNRDSLVLRDTLEIEFISLGNTPHQVFIERGGKPELLNTVNHHGHEMYKLVGRRQGLRKVNGFILKKGMLGEKKYPFEFKYFVK